ncbi:sensor histidine kinase [Streptomyces sp. NBC_01187]|uniref:sensor histidine kinase n=1 Tax=Streptomyces sp. NBC_01187 TaxID=2903766 RepID=UPI00386E32C4|nr:histidine kinase [Streptomyces sp. NBC_01187]
MIQGFSRRPIWQLALMSLPAALLLTLLVAEGLATGYAPTAAATIVSGGLCVAALVVPAGWFSRTAALALVWSLALTVVTTQLVQRPEVTFGVGEMAALLLLTARAIRIGRRLLTTVALALGSGLATAVEPLRLQELEYHNVGNYLEPVLALGFVLATVLGLYLRLLDTYRSRERAADLQAHRLEHARELHDFVAHHVTAMIAQTKAVRYASAQGRAPDPGDLDVLLAGIEQAGSQAMESMRGMVSVLRSDTSGNGVARPGTDLGALRELTEAATSTGAPATLTLDPALAELPLTPEIATAVHRVVREALTNVRKHGSGVEAITVDVRLSAQDRGRLCVVVTDDGHPAKPGRGAPVGGSGGFGLIGLTERVHALGGTLTTGPRERDPAMRGWQVAAELPLPTSVTARTGRREYAGDGLEG